MPKLLVYFALLFRVSSVVGSRLNVPRVLLPFSDVAPKFTLKAESGCYVWSSTRPDIIKLDQASPCSDKATISAVSNSGSKVSVSVLAEDSASGLVLRADVILDNIHQLRIVTKTHELYKEETPEKFEVRAYDEQGNEFSTVEGMVFKWNIEAGRTGAEILRFMNWADSPYNTEHILESLENDGKQGNKVLLEGIKTGSAKVTVRLVDSLNPAVPPTSESLMVVANLFLVPPIAYIMPGAQLQYSANQFRGSRVLKVSLPSPHHQLKVDKDLASLHQNTATLTGLNIGAGQVELVDQNVDAGEVVKTPTADLHVVPPARLELTCLPFKSWSVLVGQIYQLQVEIFDKDSNKIFLSDNIVIDLVYDNSYISISHSLTNGTLHTFKPTIAGQTDVKAILRGVKVEGVLRELPTPLSTMGTLDIFEKMTLEPALVRLPWHPLPLADGTSPQTKYLVKGGSAPYSWSSLNSSLVAVSQMGVARVSTSVIGETKVMAAMTRATHNKAMGSVAVLPAVDLKLLASELEFPVGGDLVLPLGLYPEDNHMFSRCDSVPYSLEVDAKKDVRSGIVKQASPGCAGVQVSANKLMHTKVTVGLSFPSAEGGLHVSLTDSRTVATYNPLSPVFPASGETVVAVDSSVQIVWTGGPQPWPLDPSNHFRKLSVQQDKMVKVETLRELGGVYVYRVECLTLGETSVTLNVGNEASKTLPKPVVLSSSVKVICGTPASIHLIPRIAGPEGLPPCPASARAGRIATQSYRALDIGVRVKDAAGRVFDGIESLAIDWSLSDSSLAKLAKPTGTLKPVTKDWLEQPGQPYQSLQVLKKRGKLDVKASLPSAGFLASSSSTDTVLLLLVDDARINPDKVQIFHHNTQQVVGSAEQGSGYFILESEQAGVSRVEYSPDNRSISASPVQPGTTNLVLKDLCLSAVSPAVTKLTVLGVVRVELDVLDKIQLGREVEGTVRLYAANNQLLSEDILQYISLSLTPQSDVVSLKGESNTLTPLVNGAKLGQTNLVATATYHGIKVSSAPSPVQVFPPLRIEPRNITLIIGAAFQVLTSGGPSDATIQYFLSDSEIGEVSDDGLVTGLTLGSCKLVGRAVGRSMNGIVEYSRDEVQVHVVALSGLRLQAPTEKIVVGGALPIYLLGQDDNINAYSFGSAIPNLEISWSAKGSVESKSLVSPWDSTGFALDTTNTGVAVFKGLTAGKAIISVTAKITKPLTKSQYQLLQDRDLDASIEITVVDRFQAKVPELFGNHLLVSPGSTLQLHTNRDGRADFTKACDAQNEGLSVNKRGLVTAGSNPSETVVTATIKEDGGMSQKASWVVEIGTVHYTLVQSVNSEWGLSSKSSPHLPKGGKLDIQVSCHDLLGRQFDACPVDLSIRPSRFDLTKTSSISNNTFRLTTLGSGLTVLRTSDRLSGRVAWGVLEVGEAVLAPPSLVQGDVADLQLLVNPAKNGIWSSEPSGILDISSANGVAVAIGTGYARVKYTTPSDEIFYTDITVNGNSGIQLAGEPVMSRSNEPIIIPVSFNNPGTSSNVLSRVSLPNSVSLDSAARRLFSCSASWNYGEINQVYNLRPVFEQSGWGCEFSPIPGAFFPDTPQLIKLRVTEEKGGRVGGGDVTYLPPFTVASNVVEVGPNGAIIKISGDTEVLAMLSAKGEGVQLDSGWLEDSQLHIPVYLATPIPRDAWVMIENTRTGEEVRVGVQPTFQGTPSSRGFLSALFDTLMAYYQTVLTLVVASACLFYVLRQPISSSSKPPLPAPAPAVSPAKPDMKGDEPTSPTPYLWTMDNSPIYGSPLMRRTSPQARNLSQYSYS